MSAQADPADPRGPEDAVIRFTASFDALDIEGMIPFFSATGVWKRPDGDVAGIDALRAFIGRRPRGGFTRHVISNMRTAFENGTAIVDSYVVVYRHNFSGAPTLPAPLNGPEVVGRFRDVVVNENGSWKLSLRETFIDPERD